MRVSLSLKRLSLQSLQLKMPEPCHVKWSWRWEALAHLAVVCFFSKFTFKSVNGFGVWYSKLKGARWHVRLIHFDLIHIQVLFFFSRELAARSVWAAVLFLCLLCTLGSLWVNSRRPFWQALPTLLLCFGSILRRVLFILIAPLTALNGPLPLEKQKPRHLKEQKKGLLSLLTSYLQNKSLSSCFFSF